MRLLFHVKKGSVPGSKSGPILGPLRIQGSTFNNKVREFVNSLNLQRFDIVLDINQRTNEVEYSISFPLSVKINNLIGQEKGLGKGNTVININKESIETLCRTHFGEINEGNLSMIRATARSCGWILQYD